LVGWRSGSAWFSLVRLLLSWYHGARIDNN
jgi:hypothetical protein